LFEGELVDLSTHRLAPGARFNPTAFQAVSFQPPHQVERRLEWSSTAVARTR